MKLIKKHLKIGFLKFDFIYLFKKNFFFNQSKKKMKVSLISQDESIFALGGNEKIEIRDSNDGKPVFTFENPEIIVLFL